MANFIFHCPHCNQEIEAQDEWRGQQAGCPACNKLFLIPGGDASCYSQEKKSKKSERNLIIILVVVALSVIGFGICFMLLAGFNSGPGFLIEEIAGIRLGQRVKSAAKDCEDHFHYFKISPEYRGKVRFEYAKMSKYDAEKSDYWHQDKPLLLTSPFIHTSDNGKVILLGVELTDETLAREVIRDFSKKGFGQGTQGILDKDKKAIEITDLLTSPLSSHYEFFSPDKKYKLEITHQKKGNICDIRREEVVTQFLLFKSVKQEEINPFLFNKGFIMFFGRGLENIHAIAHYNGAEGCIHKNGFDKH